MTKEQFHKIKANKAAQNAERAALESGFNAEIRRRAAAGETKESIVMDMRITRELFNRAMRQR